MNEPTKAPIFIPLGADEMPERTERFLDIEPGTGQWWIWIERSQGYVGYPATGKDMYLGPWPADQKEAARHAMNESLLVQSELDPPIGGTDCRIVQEDPDPATNDVVLIDHNDPNHTGVES